MRAVRLNNQGGIEEELKPLFERSRTERDVKFTNGRVWGRWWRPQLDKYNFDSEGRILTTCSQWVSALLRSMFCKFKYCKEERLVSQYIFETERVLSENWEGTRLRSQIC